jgi:hypothetical protein
MPDDEPLTWNLRIEIPLLTTPARVEVQNVLPELVWPENPRIESVPPWPVDTDEQEGE